MIAQPRVAVGGAARDCGKAEGITALGCPGRMLAGWIHAASGGLVDSLVIPGWRSTTTFSTCSDVSLIGSWVSWHECSVQAPQKR